MEHIDISSSDSDSEFGTSTDSEFGTDDDDIEIVNPPATSDTSNSLPGPASTTATSGTSRSLPGWASTTAISRTNVSLQGHGETCQMVCPPKTVTGTSEGHLSSSHSSQTEEKGELHQLSNTHNEKHYIEKSEKRALPSFFGSSAPEVRPNSFKSSHSSQTEEKGELHQLSNSHNEKYYIEKSEKRALPSSFGSSAPEARPNSFKSSHSSQTEEKGELHQLSNMHNEKHYVEKSEKRALPSSFGSSAPEARPNSFKSSDNLRQKNDSGRSYYSAMPIVAYEKNFMKYDGTYVLDNSRSGILPSSFVHGLTVSSGRHPSPSSYFDPSAFRSGEGRIGGPDETIIYREAIQDLNQPNQEKNVPDGLLSVTLLRHQKIALAWMLQKEARSHCLGGILADDQGLGKTVSMIALIQLQRYIDLNSKSEVKCIGRAEALTLDDDDDNVKNLEDSEGKKVSSDVISTQMTPYAQRPSAGTLIVCPATILRQWERELDEKVDPENKLRVLVYHGSNRTKDPSELAEYDVVLTTYAIVNKELPKQPIDDEDDGEQKAGAKYTDVGLNKKRKHVFSTNQRTKRRKGTGSDNGTLARVRWLRVVLDEAQTIKNHRTQVARACYTLRAKRRWCLSGTPVQNTIDELFSYFKFLKYDPYSSYKAFHETIKGRISKDPALGYKKLQVILRNVMLRRTKDTRIKGEPIISLPKKIIRMVRVNFTKEERAFYSNLESESRSRFKAYAAAGTVRQNYANIVLMLLRLRQACDHPFLVCGFSSEAVKNTPSMPILNQLPKDKLVNLLNHLESSPICQLCGDPPEDAVVALCGHVFCHQCLLDHLEDDDYTCPVHRCNTQLSSNVVFSKASLKSCISYGSRSNVSSDSQSDYDSTLFTDTYRSSKIKAAIEILKSLGNPSSTYIDLHGLSRCKQEFACTGEKIDSRGSLDDNVRTEVTTSSSSQGPTKAIVFSQWTRMLNLFESALVHSELQYRRLDGSMTLSARDEAVREFNTDPEVTVMIMSLKAGNLGLNMVAASHVILLDLWWNPTTEDQAVDRAHRIGQTRPVTVSRITVDDTVEDRILKLQEDKRKMVAAAFGEETAGATASRLSAEDLRFLFFGH